MNSNEFAIKLGKQLNILSTERVIGFGLNLCKKLIPDYVNFYKATGWGDPIVLEEVIIYVSKDLKLDNIDATKISNLILRIEAVAPDTEDFGDVDSSYALNAACSLIELLEYLLDKNTAHIINISSNVTDTLDLKIWEQKGLLIGSQLEVQQAIVVERERQLELVK